MKLNEFTIKQTAERVALMRKNDKLVNAALTFVALVYDFFGDGSLTKEVSIMEHQILCMMVTDDYEPQEFDESFVLLERLHASAIEIDDAACDCVLKTNKED